MAVQSSTRKWVFIGSGVIVAAALVVLIQNYPPQPKDAAGTIGAAQRYHEPQISGADVKVSQDELTTWIQSATFDRIVKDPQARKFFTSDAVVKRLEAGVDGVSISFDPSGAAVFAEGDAVKVKRLVAPTDADAARYPRMFYDPGLDGSRFVPVKMSEAVALKIAPSLDLDSAKRLMDTFAGPSSDRMGQRSVEIMLTGDQIRKLHLAISNPEVMGDGMTKKFSFDPSTLNGLKVAIDDASNLRVFMQNDKIRAAVLDANFVRAMAENAKLMDGLVVYARTVDMTDDPR